MTCPKCGSQISAEQRFCRSCGASLPMTTQPLAERPVVFERDQRQEIISEDGTQRANKLMLWGFMIMFMGAAIGVIGKMLIHVDAVTVVGILMALAGMFLTVYPYLSPSRRSKRDSNPSGPKVLTESQPTKSLPKERPVDYVPSITERTTDLLESTRPKQKDKESRDA